MTVPTSSGFQIEGGHMGQDQDWGWARSTDQKQLRGSGVELGMTGPGVDLTVWRTVKIMGHGFGPNDASQRFETYQSCAPERMGH